jgi:hypothetical protein
LRYEARRLGRRSRASGLTRRHRASVAWYAARACASLLPGRPAMIPASLSPSSIWRVPAPHLRAVPTNQITHLRAVLLDAVEHGPHRGVVLEVRRVPVAAVLQQRFLERGHGPTSDEEDERQDAAEQQRQLAERRPAGEGGRERRMRALWLTAPSGTCAKWCPAQCCSVRTLFLACRSPVRDPVVVVDGAQRVAHKRAAVRVCLAQRRQRRRGVVVAPDVGPA